MNPFRSTAVRASAQHAALKLTTLAVACFVLMGMVQAKLGWADASVHLANTGAHGCSAGNLTFNFRNGSSAESQLEVSVPIPDSTLAVDKAIIIRNRINALNIPGWNLRATIDANDPTIVHISGVTTFSIAPGTTGEFDDVRAWKNHALAGADFLLQGTASGIPLSGWSAPSIEVGTNRYVAQVVMTPGMAPSTIISQARSQLLAHGISTTIKTFPGGTVGLHFASNPADTALLFGSHDGAVQVKLSTLYQTVSTSAGPGGAISPAGPAYAMQGDSPRFTIAPDSCHTLVDVIVDGVSKGPVSSYTFSSVTTDHTIAATFAPKPYTISASTGDYGTINPSGDVAVSCGADQSFSVTPDSGYVVDDVEVDGTSIGPVSSYAFTAVHGNRSIHATFRAVTLGVGGFVGETRLDAAAPNPFWSRATIGFTLQQESRAALHVYDLAGRHVATLADHVLAAGRHERSWDGQDDSGARLNAGVYFYRLAVNGHPVGTSRVAYLGR